MLRPILFAAATLALATSAHAGGVPTAPQPPVVITPPAPVEQWSGFYGGVQLEFGRGDIDYGAIPGAAFPDADVDGHLAGIFFGYRHDYGSIVFGTEFDYVAGELDADTPGIDSIDSVMRATLELGLDTGNAFIYGTAGVHGTTVSTGIAIDDMDWGPVYGIGMDYRLNDRMTIGAELLQHEVDDFSGSGADLSFTTLGLNVGFQF
mgnify:CR=1 FL=1|jgi:outer membrane immunogenic protein